MSRIEQQLIDLSHQLENLRVDIAQSREQLISLEEMADDAHLRAIVSETADENQNARDMLAAKQRLEKVVTSMEGEIQSLIDKRDELLEKLYEETQD
jgi:hypothetical protein